jgi:hypothetical protein
MTVDEEQSALIGTGSGRCGHEPSLGWGTDTLEEGL